MKYMPRTSISEPRMETSSLPANGPKQTRNARAAVCAIVARLTIRFLDVGAGAESKDPYVLNTTKAIRKGRSNPFQMIAAIAYDNIHHKGRSASDVKSALLELVDEIEFWERERDGQRITPPDILPVLRVENREECGENDAALQLSTNLDSVEAHERYIDEASEEVDAQVDAIDVVRERLVLLRRRDRRVPA